MKSVKAVRLLDLDPDFSASINPEQLDHARICSQAALLEFEGPRWDPAPFQDRADPAWLGLFIVDGLLIRGVSIGSRSSCELLGPGDIFRPWDSDGDYDPVPVSLSWKIPSRVRIAVLDARFAQRIAPWPSISARLIGRIAGRARSLAVAHAVSHLPRAEARLLILFWMLAERWGRVGPDGITISLPLTHELLASLVGVRRPAVSLALQRLNRAGLLTRPERGRWILSQSALEHLSDPESLRLEGEVISAE